MEITREENLLTRFEVTVQATSICNDPPTLLRQLYASSGQLARIYPASP